jgi:transcriptional regulator with XRE-family HTH domain
MSKKKPMDKAEARERRNRMLESAAAAKLSLTEGVREMRAIAGMTQEEFARHRGVSARVIKAIELGQGNPTVATMNRIGQFFGLEVAFVPIQRELHTEEQLQPASERMQSDDVDVSEAIRRVVEMREDLGVRMHKLSEMAADLDIQLDRIKEQHEAIKEQRKTLNGLIHSSPAKVQVKRSAPKDTAANKTGTPTKKTPRAT